MNDYRKIFRAVVSYLYGRAPKPNCATAIESPRIEAIRSRFEFSYRARTFAPLKSLYRMRLRIPVGRGFITSIKHGNFDLIDAASGVLGIKLNHNTLGRPGASQESSHTNAGDMAIVISHRRIVASRGALRQLYRYIPRTKTESPRELSVATKWTLPPMPPAVF